MNWGYKIIIVFTLFATGLFFLVGKSMRTPVDMVTSNYYAEELKYQHVIDGRRQAQTLSAPVAVNQSGAALSILFPQEMHGLPLTGNVLFYRASDSRRDVNVVLNPDEKGEMLISKSRFLKGNYHVQLQWQAGGKEYYQESYVTVN